MLCRRVHAGVGHRWHSAPPLEEFGTPSACAIVHVRIRTRNETQAGRRLQSQAPDVGVEQGRRGDHLFWHDSEFAGLFYGSNGGGPRSGQSNDRSCRTLRAEQE